jgi:hypothetical protein
MLTILTVLGIVVGLIALPILINLDYGGSVWNTFDFDLTQSEKSKPSNK